MKKSPIDKLSQESLLAKLKSIGLPKLKYQSVEVVMKSYFIASNYHHHMKSLELAGLNEEVKFYRSSYKVQKTYIESVISLFKTKYEQFLEELKQNFNDPLRTLIKKFWLMKDDSTEQNLKEFLGLFKVYAKKFENVLQSIEDMPKYDLISSTFDQLINNLDNEISILNKECLNNIEKININAIDLNELSAQSDNLLNDIIKIEDLTDNSPSITPSISTNDFILK